MMNWWEFIYVVFIETGLWILLVALCLVTWFVLGLLVFIVDVIREEYEYRDWRNRETARQIAAKKRADAKKRKEVERGNSSSNNRVNRNRGRVVSNAPLN